MNDGFLGGVEHLENVIHKGAAVEEVTDVESLEVLVAVELFVVRVSDGLELRFVSRGEHSLCVATEVGAGHRNDVRTAPGDELTQVRTELVVGVRRNVVELVHGDKPVVELLHAVGIDREAKSRMGADQHLVLAVEKRAQRLHLAAVVGARRVA